MKAHAKGLVWQIRQSEPKDRRMELFFEWPSDRLRIFYQGRKIFVDSGDSQPVP